MAEKKRN